MFELGQPGEPAGIGVLLMGAKQPAVTPAGLGPAAMYSLSWLGTLPLRVLSGSLVKTTVPSPGWRGSPFPPQTAVASVVPKEMQGRVQVKPPLVERATKMPLVSLVRSKWRSA